MDKVTVKVPATTANMGPGFDCLGMALDIHNTMTLEVSDRPQIVIEGEGEKTLSRSADNLIYQTAELVYHTVKRPAPPFKLTCHNAIPLGRGLGSSASALVGGLLAGNLLCGEPLPQQDLLKMAARLEGHPDNVAPAMLGGCRVTVWNEDVISAVVPVPAGLKAVLFIPDFEMSTKEARSILPQTVSRADAVFNIARASLLVAALSTGRLEYLKVATQDRLHQTQRQAMFPAMSRLFEAALSAGALGAFLSGGGSTILALSNDDKSDAVAQAMAKAAKGAGIKGRSAVANPTAEGAHRV